MRSRFQRSPALNKLGTLRRCLFMVIGVAGEEVISERLENENTKKNLCFLGSQHVFVKLDCPKTQWQKSILFLPL